MSDPASVPVSKWKKRLGALLIVGSGLILLAAANAHLVYVAFNSQPACVPHVKSVGENASFRAAKSVC